MGFSDRLMASYLRSKGYVVQKTVEPVEDIPERELYLPFINPWSIFTPWETDELIENTIDKLLAAGLQTLVSRDRLWILMNLTRQALSLNSGEIWETGVYQGGTALLLHEVIQSENMEKTLRLFDTFVGMPETDGSIDKHRAGDFADTSVDSVSKVVGLADYIHYHKGLIPDTFSGLDESTIALAHIDLDIYSAILSACEFIYPRMIKGGFLVFDDYGFHSCPGARKAVDSFFSDKPEVPICLPTGQAIVFKTFKKE